MTDFRREMTITLDGRPLLLKGRFECLSAIEGASGKMVSEIVADVAKGKVSVDLIPAIIYGGLVGAGNPEGLTLEKVQEMCVDSGIFNLVPDVTKFFLLCISKKPGAKEETPKNEVGSEQNPAP